MDKRRLSIIATTRALAPRPPLPIFRELDDCDLLWRLSRLRAQTDNAEVADLIGEAIAAVAGMSWRPIATAPCDEAIIICTDAGTVGEGFQHSDDGSFWWSDCGPHEPTARALDARFWQPLPTAPS